MEPVHGGRDDASSSDRPAAMARLPQWSPSTEDGTTRIWTACTATSASRNGARPRRTGRPPTGRVPPAQPPAAMEPVHGGRDDPRSRWTVTGGRGRPQWSPSTEDGTTPRHDPLASMGMPPQWSPSTEDGTTTRRRARRSSRRLAAMEPVHGGRDDHWHTSTPTRAAGAPQWSPSTEDGTTTQLGADQRGRWEAAMEPVHGGRDDMGRRGKLKSRGPAAMEPVHGGRDDS